MTRKCCAFHTYADAALRRLQEEAIVWKEYGIHSNLYYILNHPSPIEELNRILSEGA